MSAAARPLVNVLSPENPAESVGQVALPAVLVAPIRMDVVQQVHSFMAKNSRQAYAVSPLAGHQHSAESWGTGRAVARIPRISGGGSHRSGQGAFGNMCRKGRMFAPTKTWRKWHKKINVNQRRFAVASALAATAIPSLVMARGHRIDQVAEVPLVLANSVESTLKSANALKLLKSVGAGADIDKVKESRKIRSGKGKLRNRRYVQRRGPLVIYNNDEGIVKSFRNVPGVELCNVERLNLLQLAPGGHLGRFVIWTQGAFERLDSIYGTFRKASVQKKGYRLPRPKMFNADLARIINSDEIQSTVRAAKETVRVARQRKNPLRNLQALLKLNPYAKSVRRAELRKQDKAGKKPKTAAKPSQRVKQALKKRAARSKAQYAYMLTE